MNTPIYNRDKPTTPGLYLALFHGRDLPDDDMHDWGFDGPLIGPLVYVHTTYACEMRLGFDDLDNIVPEVYRELFPGEVEIPIQDGLAVIGGKFYGDWTVFHHGGGA